MTIKEKNEREIGGGGGEGEEKSFLPVNTGVKSFHLEVLLSLR
jgi:hypothetical protein